MLTRAALLTTVSEKICRYASDVIPSGTGTSTSPPTRLTVAAELRLVRDGRVEGTQGGHDDQRPQLIPTKG